MEINETDLFTADELTSSEPVESDPFDFTSLAENESNNEADAPEEQQPEAVPDDEYEVTYKGEKQKVKRTREQLVTDIQKSMDYDAVRKERDELKKSDSKRQEMETIFAHFAREDGMEPDEFFAMCKAQTEEPALLEAIKAAHPEISDATARELLKLQQEKREREEAEKAEAAATAAAQADMDAVKAEFPDFDLDNIPEEVKKSIADGEKPVEAMRVYENKELRKKVAELTNTVNALQKEKNNRQRAPGRLNNYGPDEGVSPFVRSLLGG